jgi:DnaK suppressor protein
MAGDGLTPRLQQELADALIRERDRLRRGVGALLEAERALSESQGAESDAGGSPADVASDLVEEEIALALEHAEHEQLAEVEAALRRIAAGTYGYCERCGEPVIIARLYARPWARTCRRCAEQSGPPRAAAKQPAEEKVS